MENRALLYFLDPANSNHKDTQSLDQKLCNEWHSTSLAIKADIYLDFNSDNTFEIFQQIGQGAYRLYRGTWKLDGDILSGKYNDGETWLQTTQSTSTAMSLR